jgi:hypothetical protein
MKRPTSISVIAWILIVVAIISLISSAISLNNPMAKALMAKSLLPISLQYVMLYAGLIVQIVSAIAMLKGQNWARFLYVIWSVIGSIIGIATSPMKAAMIPGIVIFIVIAFFLFRPKANEYFHSNGNNGNAQSV